jgi:hypothetical protein
VGVIIRQLLQAKGQSSLLLIQSELDIRSLLVCVKAGSADAQSQAVSTPAGRHRLLLSRYKTEAGQLLDCSCPGWNNKLGKMPANLG